MTTLITGKATEFINFTRGSNATVTDSNGLIEWAAHNLLLASEQFDASNWTKGASSVTGNSIAAPNGLTTADTLVEDGTTANHRLIYTLVTIGARHTFGVFLKAGSRDWAYLRISDGGAVARHAYFNLSTGAIGTVETNLSAQITSVGSGWYLCTVTVSDANAGSNPLVLGLTTADNTNSHAGNGTGSIHVWGAHLYRSDMGMQANTSAYPMYNPTTPKNLLGYTEDFSNWAKTVAGDTITLNAATAPNGLQTADLWVADGTSANHRLDQTVSVQPTTGTYSFYAKLQTASAFIQISQSGNNAGWVNFDLVNGTKSDQGTGITGSITSVGNGWYRCSAYNTNSPSANLRLSLVTGLTAARIETAAISSGIYLWGAQLSDSASLDSYVPVYGAAVTSAAYYGPRRDFDPVTLACKGLLVEEQRANLRLNSATSIGSIPGTVLSTGNSSPDGANAANGFTEDVSAVERAVAGFNLTQNQTVSFFVRRTAGASTRYIAILATNVVAGGAFFNLSTGTAITNSSSDFTAAITPIGSYWRCSVTRVNATAQDLSLLITEVNTPYSGSKSYTGDGVSKFLFWGFQLEAGSFATSYIPTGAATATRSADAGNVSTQAFPYSSTEGTLVVNASSPCIAAIANMITLDNGTTQERIRLLTDVASLKTIVTESNTTQANLSPGSATANIPFKFAVAYKVNDFAAVVNGSAAATDAAGNVPVVNIARLGADNSGNYLNGHIRQITYLPRRISNTELQTRTA